MSRQDSEYTNGEILAMVAPIFHVQPEELLHAVVIVIKQDTQEIKTATTECNWHTAGICLELVKELGNQGLGH